MADNRYLSILDQVKNMTLAGCYKDAHDLLLSLYEIKPIRLKWYIEMARLMAADKMHSDYSVTEAIQLLEQVCDPDYIYESVPEYYELLMELNHICNREQEVQRLRVQYELMRRYYGQAECDELNDLDRIECGLDRALLELERANNGLKSAKSIQKRSQDGQTELEKYLFVSGETQLSDMLSEKHHNWVLDLYTDVTYLVLYNQYTCEQTARIAFHLLKRMGYEVKLIQVQQKVQQTVNQLESYLTDSKHMYILVGAGTLINEITMSETGKRWAERLTEYHHDYLEHQIAFARCGSYLSYINHLYQEDEELQLQKPAECAISIVIPARNAADTLAQTLKTCLEQSFTDYEILLSDNSEPDHTAVYELYQSLLPKAGGRLRYIHTPTSLPLHRSFEYAYLHARGDFIFSLGSDDGVLPWALEDIATELKRYPQEDIFQWNFGGFYWPNTDHRINPEYRNVFNMGSYNEQHILKAEQKESKSYLKELLADARNMYRPATFYIHSGFRREYLRKLLKESGRLIGGQNQDICTGIVNMSLNSHDIRIKNVLTIVGQSGNSLGCMNLRGFRSIDEVERLSHLTDHAELPGSHYQSYIEKFVPDIGGEVIYGYSALLYGVSIGVLGEEIMDQIDWKRAFSEIVWQMNFDDCYYEKKLTTLRAAVSKLGDELLAWFDATFYEPCLRPHKIDETTNNEQSKAYTEALRPDGSFIIDASKHNIRNIYEAVQYAVDNCKHITVND